MTASREPTVFVVDDDEQLRAATSDYLRAAGFAVEEFRSAESFLGAHDPARPGCMVLDLRMPGIGGLELQSFLSGRAYCMPIIIVTGYADVSAAVRTLSKGAFHFLEKPFDPDELVDLVRRAIEKDRKARAEHAATAQVRERLSSLTDRERQIVVLLVEGRSNREVAEQLGISMRTVEAHRSRIMLKLRVESMAELIRLAILGGLSVAPPGT